MPDGTKEPAQLVGHDVWTDLAVISINSKMLKQLRHSGIRMY